MIFLFGTGSDDVIDGLGGLDRINGFGGNDLIDGGPDDDIINGGEGNDAIDGGDGNDAIGFFGFGTNEFDRLGDDIIFGGNGDDQIRDEFGINIIHGGAGNDSIQGSSGELFGDGGNDGISGQGGNDIINGGDGDDRLSGGRGDDELTGGAGSDQFEGDEGNDRLIGDGENNDIALYNNAFVSLAFFRDFEISIVNGSGTVTDLNPSDGDLRIDTLTGIHRLRFRDQEIDTRIVRNELVLNSISEIYTNSENRYGFFAVELKGQGSTFINESSVVGTGVDHSTRIDVQSNIFVAARVASLAINADNITVENRFNGSIIGIGNALSTADGLISDGNGGIISVRPGANLRVSNHGLISSLEGSAIQATNGVNLSNGNTGVIQGTFGITAINSDLVVNNAGEIRGIGRAIITQSGDGLIVDGYAIVTNTVDIVNVGKISGNDFQSAGLSGTIRLSGFGSNIVNHGIVEGVYYVRGGVNIHNFNVSSGDLFIDVASVGQNSNINLNSMGFTFVSLNNEGIFSGNVLITGGAQFIFDPPDPVEFVTIVNNTNILNGNLISDPTIQSLPDLTIPRATFVERISNSGSINGNIDLGDGDDILVNSGFISGSIDLGRGFDVIEFTGSTQSLIFISNPAVSNGFIVGNNFVIDAESIVGGSGDDFFDFSNHAQNIVISGGSGNDVIFGAVGGDSLSGGAGNDVIYGDTPTVTSVMAGVGASLGASDYAILYQGPSYNLNAIAASNHDLLIIPAARTISFPQAGRNLESLWTAGEINQIQSTGKKLVGYLDLAKINDFQVDWQASWTTNGRANGTLTANAPSWLGAYETAAGVENTTIRAANFADPAWRQFLFNRVDTLIGQGFNGVFFDDVGEYFARNVGSIPNIAQAARDMRDLIIDVAAHARQTVAALRGTAAADAFSIIINGDPFLITNSTADGSSPNSARNALFYDTVDALLGENYFSIANNGLAVTKAISEFTSRGITLLSADTGGASNLTPQQQQDIIRAAVSAGFLPFTTPSPLYHTLGIRLNPATIPAPIAGNDLLDGGTGADRLLGGVGNDTYVIDDIGDVVTEFSGEGVDIVQSSVDHTLGNNFENLTLTGTTNLNGNGNAANNIINGNAGANAIDGRGGNDTLAGFGGDDVYVVDSAGDIIIETVGGGIDIVFAETSYVLSGAAEVEVFSARSQAETLAVNLTGNNFDQLIRGNAGANAIDGRGGNDTLFGFGGNDTFTFLNGFGNDHIGDFDANPDGGQDLLDLRAFGVSSASFDNQVTIAQQGLNTFISFGGGSILLAGVNAADITQSDFIL